MLANAQLSTHPPTHTHTHTHTHRATSTQRLYSSTATGSRSICSRSRRRFPYWFGAACLIVNCQQIHLLFINLMHDSSVNRRARQNKLPGCCPTECSGWNIPNLIVPQEWFNKHINCFYLLITLELNGLLLIFINPNNQIQWMWFCSLFCCRSFFSYIYIYIYIYIYTVYFGA